MSNLPESQRNFLSSRSDSQPSPSAATDTRSVLHSLRAYVAIARPDHWIKNVFMILGVLLAYFYHPELVKQIAIGPVLWAIATTCLLASSNYVLNEILDAPTDRNHPVKRLRPIPSGRVRLSLAYAEWVFLGTLGLAMASMLNRPFFLSAMFLLIMGAVYNVPPIRSKELPYLDVLSESINNPIRLLLGWFAVTQSESPPFSLLVSYWMLGAFFMAAKRFAEYRFIGNPAKASAYRPSFRYYDDQKLLISMFFYTTCFAIFLGVFIVRWHLELILFVPVVAGFMSYYLYVAFKHESAAQSPERLYREKGLIVYLVISVVVFVGLMFVEIPIVYQLLNVPHSQVPPLWKF